MIGAAFCLGVVVGMLLVVGLAALVHAGHAPANDGKRRG